MVTKFFNFQLCEAKVTLKSLEPEESHDWTTKITKTILKAGLRFN